MTKLTREQAERIYAEVAVLRAYDDAVASGDDVARARIRSERPDLSSAFDDIDAEHAGKLFPENPSSQLTPSLL